MGMKAFLFNEEIFSRVYLGKPVTSVTLVTRGNELINLNEFELDSYEERAAIFQYDAGMNREDAERLALRLILERRN